MDVADQLLLSSYFSSSGDFYQSTPINALECYEQVSSSHCDNTILSLTILDFCFSDDVIIEDKIEKIRRKSLFGRAICNYNWNDTENVLGPSKRGK